MKASMWTQFFRDQSIDEAMDELAEAGFRWAELSCEMVRDPRTRYLSRARAEHIALCARHVNVGIGQVHFPIRTMDPQGVDASIAEGSLSDFASTDPRRREFELTAAEDLLALCPVMDIPVMVVHPGGAHHADTTSADLHAENVEVFRRLAPVAQKHNVVIAIENMGAWMGRRHFGVELEDLLGVIEEVDSPALGICYDSSHANFSGVDHGQFIRGAGARLVATHLSDNLGQGDNHLLPWGGTVPWPDVVGALKEIDYRGLVNLEIPGENGAPLEVLRLKARYAHQLLEAMWA